MTLLVKFYQQNTAAFSSKFARGGIWILDLRIMCRVFYHCATCGTESSVLPLCYTWHRVKCSTTVLHGALSRVFYHFATWGTESNVLPLCYMWHWVKCSTTVLHVALSWVFYHCATCGAESSVLPLCYMWHWVECSTTSTTTRDL